MVNTSVSRAHLEPSTAVECTTRSGCPARARTSTSPTPASAFVNGMQLAAAMIDTGQIDYALVVNGEDARPAHEAALRRLAAARPRPPRR